MGPYRWLHWRPARILYAPGATAFQKREAGLADPCVSVFHQTDRHHVSGLSSNICFFWVLQDGRLKPLDVEIMKKLGTRVNLIPVIAKADTMTPEDLHNFKTIVSRVFPSLLMFSLIFSGPWNGHRTKYRRIHPTCRPWRRSCGWACTSNASCYALLNHW